MKHLPLFILLVCSLPLWGQRPYNIVQEDNFLRVVNGNNKVERELFLGTLAVRDRADDDFELDDGSHSWGNDIDHITNFATVTSLFNFITPLRQQVLAGGNDTISIAVLADSDADTKIEVELNPDEDSIHVTVEGIEVISIDSGEVNFLQEVSFGHNNPTADVDIGNAVTPGTLRYRDGNQALNKVLTSDGSGNATWQLPSQGVEIIDGDSDTYVRVDSGSDSDTVSVSTAGTERITVLPNGNVGFAKDDPAQTVDIDGSLYVLDTLTGDSLALLSLGDNNAFSQDGIVAGVLNPALTEQCVLTLQQNTAQLRWIDLAGGPYSSLAISKPDPVSGYGIVMQQKYNNTDFFSGFSTTNLQSDHYVYRSDYDLDISKVQVDSSSVDLHVIHDIDDGSNYNRTNLTVLKDTVLITMGSQTGSPAQAGANVTYQMDTAQLIARNYKFDVNQDISGLDGYILTYDSGDGEISLESAAAAAANYAGISVRDNATPLSLLVEDQWYQIVNFDTNDPNAGSTPDHTTDDITASATRDYMITFDIGFSGTGNDDYEIMGRINNGATDLDNVFAPRRLGTGGDTGSAGGGGIVSLTDTDTVELWARCTSGGSKSITVQSATLSIVGL